METKHVSKKVTLTVKEWETLGQVCSAAAANVTHRTPNAAAVSKVLGFMRDLALVAVDEAGK
jgi:hypothetical protein